MGEILINQLFAGAYLQEGTNIGHEVINLFRDDNDENYLYITPMGNVKGHNVDKVLFVQNIAGRETMEVVMKAEGLSNTSADDVQKIFYAGVNITDIFNKNQMIISKNPQFTGISARQQLEFTTHLLLTD